MSSFGRDPVISGKTTIARVEVKGTWPNLSLRINDMEVNGVLDASLNLGTRADPPRLTVELLVTDLDVEIDGALMDGSVIILKPVEQGGEQFLSADRIVLDKEPEA